MWDEERALRTQAARRSEPPEKRTVEALEASFPQVIRRFVDMLEAQKELLADLDKLTAQYDAPESRISSEVRGPTGASPEQTARAVSAALALVQTVTDQARTEHGIPEKGIRFIFRWPAPENETSPVQRAADDFVTSCGGDAAVANREFLAALTALRKPPRREILIYAIVPSIVSAFEVLVGGLMGAFYRERPQALGPTEKQFSLDDLRKFSSLDEAVSRTIDARVDSLMRGSLDDWVQWFERQAKISLPAISPGWQGVVEFVERRNIIIHQHGRVSEQYVNRVEHRDEVKLGERLHTSDVYVRERIDLVFKAGVLAGVFLWAKTKPDDPDAPLSFITEVIYRALIRGDWKIVRALAASAAELRGTEAALIVNRVNGWLADKRLGGSKAIHGEVEAWDTSALGRRFTVAKLALLDEVRPALELLADLIAHGELTAAEAEEWPLFEELRATHGWKRAVYGELGDVEVTV
jgi:hypothetical protein